MTGLNLEPRDDGSDWMDEAVLVSILAIQMGNSSANRASLAFARGVRRDVFDAIREMGLRPTRRAVRIAMAKIDKAFKGASAATRAAIERDIISLVQMETRALPASVTSPGRRELLDRISKSEVLGRTTKSYVSDWLETSARDKVKARVKHLSASGTSPTSIISRIKQDIVGAARGAGSIARTALSGASSLVRKLAAKESQRKLIWISVLDDRTTVQCAALDGEVWPESEPHLYPPIHINCRSSVGIHMGGSPDSVDYEGWLKRQSVDVQETVLGIAKSKAWREGRLTLDQMVDITKTKPLSIDELKRLGRW